MKQYLHSLCVALLALVLCNTPLFAHDFEVDGIYYKITSSTDKMVEVTCRGTPSSYSNEYSGTVTIPESVAYNGSTYSVTSIGWYAFDNCPGLTSVTIPNSVTSIGYCAFAQCDGLTSVTIPNSVTSIGEGAFYLCYRLTSVTIGNSVTSIGKSAFTDCYGLTSVTIPNSVTSIGEGAFSYCYCLTSVTIPNSVTSIGYKAFESCSGLTSVVVEDGNPKYDSRNNCNAIIETAKNILYLGCKTTIIPNSVTSIGESAFNGCSGLTSVTIPNSVTSIGAGAFYGCYGLTSVTIPNSVTSIGLRAFEDCDGLTSVSIPNSVTSIGGSAFESCSGLTSVNIPNGVESIGNNAFSGCSGLTSVTIPNSVTSIGEEAFEGCSGLTSVVVEDGNPVYDSRNNCNAIIETATNTLHSGCKTTIIPNSVTSIGDYAFEDCSGLISVTIPNSVTSIGHLAFADCSKLLYVYCYAENVPSTDSKAFNYSPIADATLHVPDASIESYKTTEPWSSFGKIVAITTEDDGINYDFNADTKQATVIAKSSGKYSGEVVIPEFVEHDGTAYSVTSIGRYAFYECSSLTSVTIPNSVTSIGGYAFYGCPGLTSVAIPDSVWSIGDAAFYDCSGLTSVTIPNSVWSIGKSAFSYCSGLTSVTIPNSVTSIGWSAFSGCSGLTSVTIGSSVTSIGSEAFRDCSELLDVYCYAEKVPSTKSYAFESSPIANATLHVPVVSVESYKATEPWSSFEKIVAISTEIDGINYDFDAEAKQATVIAKSSGEYSGAIVIPESVEYGGTIYSVTSIGETAFYGCSGLTSVTIPNSVTSIGDYAFYACSGLASVTIGNSVTSIGERALSGCSNLSCITCLNPFPPACEEFTFYNVLTSKCKLLVPIGSESAYSAANGWKEFSEILGKEAEVDPDPETYSAFVINDTTVMAGSTFTMPVELKNSCEVTAFQCDIYLPEGISLQKNNKDKYEISLDENRKDDHTITIAEQPDGSIRIVVASLSSSTFSGTEGTLLNMALLAAEDTSGEKNIAIKNVYISEANGKRHDLADAEATVTIQTYTPADVNNDGMIAIDDVVLTINTVLGNVPENFVFDAADMNGDGRILIDDVVRIINVVLGIYAPPVSNVRRNDVNERFILNQKETGVGISVSNAAGYTAMQYDMHMPEGAEVSDVRFTGKSNHKVSFRKINENVVRVVVVSLTNEVFSGNELLDVVIETALDTEISIKDANVATRSGIKGNVQDASVNIGGNTTAIDQLLDGMARADVHDLNGRLVKKNAATITDLQKGIYIINGKRIIR